MVEAAEMPCWGGRRTSAEATVDTLLNSLEYGLKAPSLLWTNGAIGTMYLFIADSVDARPQRPSQLKQTCGNR